MRDVREMGREREMAPPSANSVTPSPRYVDANAVSPPPGPGSRDFMFGRPPPGDYRRRREEEERLPPSRGPASPAYETHYAQQAARGGNSRPGSRRNTVNTPPAGVGMRNMSPPPPASTNAVPLPISRAQSQQILAIERSPAPPTPASAPGQGRYRDREGTSSVGTSPSISHQHAHALPPPPHSHPAQVHSQSLPPQAARERYDPRYDASPRPLRRDRYGTYEVVELRDGEDLVPRAQTGPVPPPGFGGPLKRDRYGTYWEAIDVKDKDEESAPRSQTASRPGPSQPSRVALDEGMEPPPSNGSSRGRDRSRPGTKGRSERPTPPASAGRSSTAEAQRKLSASRRRGYGEDVMSVDASEPELGQSPGSGSISGEERDKSWWQAQTRRQAAGGKGGMYPPSDIGPSARRERENNKRKQSPEPRSSTSGSQSGSRSGRPSPTTGPG